MKVLVGAACIAIIAAVGYFFWSENEKRLERAAVTRAITAIDTAAIERECNRRLTHLKAWKEGTPLPEAGTFASTRESVEACFVALKGSAWASANAGVIYW